MITIANLTKDDIGRKVTYGRKELPQQEGTISSWNETYIFVKFGEHANACDPGDVSFAFEHCTVDTAGFKITGADAQLAIDCLNKYFHDFAVTDGKCPQCGARLGGLLGSFTWGLAHGEGYCTGNMLGSDKCHWPCRAYHRPALANGEEIFEQTITNVLPYHPDVVQAKPLLKSPTDKEIIKNSWLSLAAKIKLRPSGVQYEEMRRAFFAGAYTVMGVLEVLNDDTASALVLESMSQECEAFKAEFKYPDPEAN